MGIKSKSNWSGTRVDGVVLGEPAYDEATLTYEWDGGVPNGEIDAAGDFQPDGFLDDGVTKPPKEDFVTKEGVEPKPPKLTEEKPVKVPKVDEKGDPVLDEEGNPVLEDGFETVPKLYYKEDIVVSDGVAYRCNKDGIPFDLALKDWGPLKGVK